MVLTLHFRAMAWFLCHKCILFFGQAKEGIDIIWLAGNDESSPIPDNDQRSPAKTLLHGALYDLPTKIFKLKLLCEFYVHAKDSMLNKIDLRLRLILFTGDATKNVRI